MSGTVLFCPTVIYSRQQQEKRYLKKIVVLWVKVKSAFLIILNAQSETQKFDELDLLPVVLPLTQSHSEFLFFLCAFN